MHEIVNKWIVELLLSNPGVLSIALRQRAKFEGWLKFELAASAEKNGATNVEVEALSSGSGLKRSDIALRWNGVRYAIELKTPNTNWRVEGVQSKTRPITKNISGIIADAQKLARTDCEGLVAFVMFPLPNGDRRWHEYLERIGQELQIPLSPEKFARQITLPISEQHSVDVVSCCFSVAHTR